LFKYHDEIIEQLLYSKSLIVDKIMDNKINLKNTQVIKSEDTRTDSIFGQLINIIINNKDN